MNNIEDFAYNFFISTVPIIIKDNTFDRILTGDELDIDVEKMYTWCEDPYMSCICLCKTEEGITKEVYNIGVYIDRAEYVQREYSTIILDEEEWTIFNDYMRETYSLVIERANEYLSEYNAPRIHTQCVPDYTTLTFTSYKSTDEMADYLTLEDIANMDMSAIKYYDGNVLLPCITSIINYRR